MINWLINNILLPVFFAIIALLILWGIYLGFFWVKPTDTCLNLADYSSIAGAIISLMALFKVIFIDKVVQKIKKIYSLTIFFYDEYPEFRNKLAFLSEFQTEPITEGNSREILVTIKYCKEWIQRLKSRIKSSSIDSDIKSEINLTLKKATDVCEYILNETKYHGESTGTSGKSLICQSDIITLFTDGLSDEFKKRLQSFGIEMKGYRYG